VDVQSGWEDGQPQVDTRRGPLYCEWIGNDRQVRAIIAEMREVVAQAQRLMLEETDT
jgi:hypothetical protein